MMSRYPTDVPASLRLTILRRPTPAVARRSLRRDNHVRQTLPRRRDTYPKRCAVRPFLNEWYIGVNIFNIVGSI